MSVRTLSIELPLSKVKIKKRLNKLDEYSIVFANIDEFREAIQYGAEIELYYMGAKRFHGIVGKTTYHDEKIEMRGKEVAQKLKWQLFQKYGSFRVSYTDEWVSTIVDDILLGTGFSVGSVPTQQITIRFEFKKKLECLIHIAEVLDKDWWFDYKTFSIGDKGSDKGEVPGSKISTKTEDPERIVNVVYQLGYGDGINQPSSIVQDIDSRLSYGTREDAFVDRKVTEESTLNLLATAKLQQRKGVIEEIPITVDADYAMRTNLVAGDYITVKAPRKKLDGLYRISELTIGAMEESRMELSERQARISDQVDELIRSITDAQKFMQGGTTIFQIPYIGTMDANTKFRFYLASDLLKLNRVKLTFQTEETDWTNVRVKINGTAILDSTSDITEQDITTYCDPGWNWITLEYTPAATKNVTINLSIQSFIEAV